MLGFVLFSKILFSSLKMLTLAPSYRKSRTYCYLEVPEKVTHFCYGCFKIKTSAGINIQNFTA